MWQEQHRGFFVGHVLHVARPVGYHQMECALLSPSFGVCQCSRGRVGRVQDLIHAILDDEVALNPRAPGSLCVRSGEAVDVSGARPELPLTGDSIDASEAHRLGMVRKVFPNDESADKTLEFAQRIANTPTVAALLIKEAVNQTVDNMGFTNALNASFSLHELNHSHWASISKGERVCGVAEFDEGIQDWRNAPPVQLAQKDAVGGQSGTD